jgi:hypothetical protein
MALTGFGVIPSGSVGTELAAVTRRAVMPGVVVQLGKATPALSAMLASAEGVSGGVSPMTIPVQGTRMVTASWTDYSGAGSAPMVTPGLLNAEYNLKAITTWIPFFLMEGLIQQAAELVPLAWARMNDAGNVVSDDLATRLFAALSANTALQPFSLFDVMATTDPSQGNLGNIAVSNTWWKGNTVSMATIDSGSQAITRAHMLAAIQYAQKASGGEPPSCVLLAPGAWAALAADVITGESYRLSSEGSYGEVGEGPNIAFPALRIADIPVYSDPYLTVGTVALMPNFNYLGYKMHQEASFVVLGPESLLPQYTLGYVMVMLALLELVCTKRSAQSQVTALTGALVI